MCAQNGKTAKLTVTNFKSARGNNRVLMVASLAVAAAGLGVVAARRQHEAMVRNEAAQKSSLYVSVERSGGGI